MASGWNWTVEASRQHSRQHFADFAGWHERACLAPAGLASARIGLRFRGDLAYLAAMKKPRKVIQPRWGVYRLGGKRAERMLFTVTAPNSENEIPERDRWRHVIEAERIFARQLQGIARLSIQGLDTRRPVGDHSFRLLDNAFVE